MNTKILYDINEIKNIVNYEINSFETYIGFSKLFKNYINNKYEQLLNGKEKCFVDAVVQNHVSLYRKNNSEEKNRIYELISEKRKLIIQIYQELLLEGFFDKFYNNTEKIILNYIIQSNIISSFDEIFVKREKNMNDLQTKEKNYGGVINGQIVGYGEFLNDQKLFVNESENIDGLAICEYINNSIKLICSGETQEKKWLEIEKYYMNSWIDDNKIGLVGVLENYLNPSFIDPEIDLHVKQKLDKHEKQQIIDLSKKYFNDSYMMDQIIFTKVEQIFSGGSSGFSKVLGRNFPNDLISKKNFGNAIYIIVSAIFETFDLYKDYVGKVITDLPIKYKSDIENELLIEVIYHEFGHNLFSIKINSNLEELKATLYYYLKLYDDLINNKLNIEQSIIILYTLIFDAVKNFARYQDKKYYKYVLLNRVIYYYAIKNSLISFNNSKLSINPGLEKMKVFLKDLKNILFDIQKYYGGENPEFEEKFIDFITQSTQDDLIEIANILNSN